MNEEQKTDLTTRVKQVLIECRVVLPGAQALLGFQLIIMWMTAFYKIPQAWKLLHLASLMAVAISTILLITPAAYHRIVEQGEDSEMLHHITARLLLGAMVFLALGICGDFYVVCRMTGIGTAVSATLSLLLADFFYGAWFGYTLLEEARVARSEADRVASERSQRGLMRSYVYTGCVQNAQRCASIGMSLWHSGHFFLSGSACFSKRFISVFTGRTTK